MVMCGDVCNVLDECIAAYPLRSAVAMMNASIAKEQLANEYKLGLAQVHESRTRRLCIALITVLHSDTALVMSDARCHFKFCFAPTQLERSRQAPSIQHSCCLRTRFRAVAHHSIICHALRPHRFDAAQTVARLVVLSLQCEARHLM